MTEASINCGVLRRPVRKNAPEPLLHLVHPWPPEEEMPDTICGRLCVTWEVVGQASGPPSALAELRSLCQQCARSLRAGVTV